jgi:transcriptional regulator with XRE-family HTH domain
MSDIFQKLLPRVPKDTAQFINQSMDITLTIKDLLRKKGLTQKDLAQKLGKSEAEISKWLTTGYNLTLKTIAKIEVALEEQIIIPAKFVEEYEGSYKLSNQEYVFVTLKHSDAKKIKYQNLHQSVNFVESSNEIQSLSNKSSIKKGKYNNQYITL